MVDNLTYALMAGDAYISTRPNMLNQFPVPQGWSEFFHRSFDSGFEAVSFTNGTEIVISYAGTGSDVDWFANIGLGLGVGASQLFQAAEYYMQVKADNPGVNITFTGHSLGGGLASLLAVFFNETAVTFDQAPFRDSSDALMAAALRIDLANKFPAAIYPQISTWLDPLDKYILSFDPFGLGWSQDGLAAREAKVSNINVQGEFLSLLPLVSRIGTPTTLTHGTTDLLLAADLHSQALLSAFLLSDKTAASSPTFRDVTFKLPDLIRLIFNKDLYSFDTKLGNENFIERLVRHQVGNAPGVMTADAMLTRFIDDMWKLAQTGGLTMSDGVDVRGTNIDYLHNVSKALTAFAMQMYYEDTANATNKDKELFTKIAGGVQFDMADVSTTFKVLFEQHEKINLNDAKGYQYFDEYLNGYMATFFTDAERGQINTYLPTLRDWYVQAGASGMIATDTLSWGAFIPHSPSLAEDKNLFEVLGNAANDIQYAIQLERKSA